MNLRLIVELAEECQFDDQEQKDAISHANSFLEATRYYLKEQNLLSL